MEANVDRLYNLLPAIYRVRDAEKGWKLRALLRVIAEQANAIETDITQLYNNWFIETCQDWVIPYIGDLIGYQLVHEAGEPGDVTTEQGRQRNKILISRRDVANTIRARRRKGTLALLEDLSRDVASWPYSHAVEFYKLLGITQTTNYRQLNRGRTVNIRDSIALEHIGGPFAQEAHTVDVRRISSHRTPGRYNLPSIGLFVWRLKVYPVEKTEAYDVEEVPHGYTFSALGNDTQLYTHPNSTTEQSTPVNELNFPNPISRQAFEKHLADYYGKGKSIQIWTIEAPAHSDTRSHGAPQHRQYSQHGPTHQHHSEPSERHSYQSHHISQSGSRLERSEPARSGQQRQQGQQSANIQVAEGRQPDAQVTSGVPQSELVDISRIVPADLSEWQYRPEPPDRNQPGKVAVDPVLGRIVFPPGHQPKQVLVSYHYAFSDDIGGGAYNRPILQAAQPLLYQVCQRADPADPAEMLNPHRYNSLHAALAAWNTWKSKNSGPYNAVIEIIDNGVYTEQLDIHLEEGESLQIRAANRKRPIIRLVDWNENLPDSLKVTGELGSRFTLDGLIITGRAVRFEGDVASISIRHCTLVPGWGLHSDCKPHLPTAPSLELFNIREKVTIEHSILGAILVYENEAREEPLRLFIGDSIVDATNPEHYALSGPEKSCAYTILTLARCTVFGRILVHAIALAENSIFSSQATVARRQWGCMRFCSLTPPESRLPRRYNCQPDLVEQVVDTNKKLKALSAEKLEKIKARARDHVQPVFNSVRYGTPTYCQLAFSCAPEITRGADDESEMGVFHELYQPQREANLRARLDDFTPASMEAGIIYVS
jgi:hypothetical protein